MAQASFQRSPVLGTGGSVACTQPLASQIGIDILKRGGNAADACVAMAAALSVTEPYSTGLGGDCFCLFYDAKSKQVKGINGSGRAPAALDLESFRAAGYDDKTPPPPWHALNITVPGSAAGWVDTLDRFGSGKVSLSDVLAPAIQLADEGFPVGPKTAAKWENSAGGLMRDGNNLHSGDLLINGKAPRPGQIMKMPHMANTLKSLSQKGKEGFYKGPVAESIVEAVQAGGGVMTLDDLQEHTSTNDDPIFTTYKGIKVWECPPNGQGITTLVALNILEEFDLAGLSPASPEYIHVVTEALKLCFADSLQYCADPSQVHVPVEGLLSREYSRERSRLINRDRAAKSVTPGNPSAGDTVYFCVIDGEGNACSFANSLCKPFGSGLVPKNCGFSLQNRGSLFILKDDHPNCPAGRKRSYHTIIPAMMTRAEDDKLLAAYGVMGGFMQPQGHVQVAMNMIHFGMDPQAAVDHPRFRVKVEEEGSLALEEGIPEETITALTRLGHKVHPNVLGQLGKGQVITRGDWWAEPGQLETANESVLWAGSDTRADGIAVAY